MNGRAALVDSHVHLDWFPPEALDGIVERAAAAGVGTMLTVGSDVDSSRIAAQIADRYPPVLAAVGIHPAHLVGELLDRDLSAIGELAQRGRVVAIGEVGLDSVAAKVPLEVQERALRAQVRLARELDLPLVLHVRGALRETLLTLDGEGLPAGRAVVHYFTGDAAESAEWVRRGIYVSFGKPVLRSAELRATATSVPLGSLLVETDAYPRAPDRWTEPADVRLVVEALAALRGTTVGELSEVVAANFQRLFRR